MTQMQQSFLLPKRKKHSARFEEEFAAQCRQRRVPQPIEQFRFAKDIDRQWRFDFAFMEQRVAVEIEGLVVRRIAGQLVTGGRHATISGMRDDMEKYNTAQLMGWVVLRFEQGQIKPGHAIDVAMRMLAARGWNGPT